MLDADRLTDKVLDKVEAALTRMLALGEVVDSIDFQLSAMPTQNGVTIIGLVYISLKGPVFGQSMSNIDAIFDLTVLSSQAAIDTSVRASLDSIRARKSQVLLEAATLRN